MFAASHFFTRPAAFAWRHKILDALQELAGGVDNIPIKVGEQVRRINAA